MSLIQARYGADVAAWLSTEALSFDVETTGTDVFNDRIVTASCVSISSKGATDRGSWLLNPGVPIPAAAAAIHGITDEKAQAEGWSALSGIVTMASCLQRDWNAGLPVIICNAPFDLTMLQAELERHGQEPLRLGPVLDPLVIDRAMDPYRKGKRTLTALAAHYKVQQGEAHNSRGDALTAARVVWRQAQVYRHLATMTLEQMQDLQRNAHHDWAVGFEKHLRSQGKNETVSRDWPIRRKGAA